MKTLSGILSTIIAFLLSGEAMAQKGHSVSHTHVQMPHVPRAQVPRPMNNPHVNVHAYSNTVFRSPSSQVDNKKNAPKKEAAKKEVSDKQPSQKKEKKGKE